MASPSAAFALFGYCLIAVALAQNFGHFSTRAIILTLLAAVLWTIGLMRARAPRSGDMLQMVRIIAWVAAAAGILVSWVARLGLQTDLTRFNPYVLSAVQVTMLVILGSYLPDLVRRRTESSPLVRYRKLALFLTAISMGVLALYAAPNPTIDVFHMHQQGAERLLSLEPVYGNVKVLDSNSRSRWIKDYVYPPMNLVMTTLTVPITGDTRWSSLIALIVTAYLIQRIARRRVAGDDVLPELLAAAFLLHPRAGYILAAGWGDSLALPFAAAFALYADKHKETAAAVFLGLVCATKQYMLVFGASALLLPRLGLRGACVAGAVVAATLLPFALWTPAELWEGLVVHHLDNQFRRDALSIPAFLARQGLTPPPSWVGFLAIPAVLIAALRLPRRIDVAVATPAIALTWFFLFGRQAFANYYHFVSGVALIWAALCLGPADPASRAEGQRGDAALGDAGLRAEPQAPLG